MGGGLGWLATLSDDKRVRRCRLSFMVGSVAPHQAPRVEVMPVGEDGLVLTVNNHVVAKIIRSASNRPVQ